MKYAVIESAGSIVLRERDIPAIEPNRLLVRVTRAGICAATELHLLRGETGAPFPLHSFNSCFGHEGAGIVMAAGPAVVGFSPGDRIVYLGPCYCEYALVNPELAVALPPKLSFDEILGEPFAVALNTVDHVMSTPPGTIVLLGTGFMGLLILQGLSSISAGTGTIIAADINGEKLQMAMKHGAAMTVNLRETDLAGVVNRLTGGCGANTVIEASGSHEALRQCGPLAAAAGRIILHGHYVGSPSIDLDPWHVKELTIINSHPHSPGRYRELLCRACDAAVRGVFDVTCLVTHRYSLERLPEAFDAMADDRKFVKAVVDVGTEAQ